MLLANLYAETGWWEEEGKVMRTISVNKAPVQSLIEEGRFQLTNVPIANSKEIKFQFGR